MGSWSAAAEPFVRAHAAPLSSPSIPFSHSISWLFSGAALMGRQSCRNVINVVGPRPSHAIQPAARLYPPLALAFMASGPDREECIVSRRTSNYKQPYADFASIGGISKTPTLFWMSKHKPPMVNLTCSVGVVL